MNGGRNGWVRVPQIVERRRGRTAGHSLQDSHIMTKVFFYGKVLPSF